MHVVGCNNACCRMLTFISLLATVWFTMAMPPTKWGHMPQVTTAIASACVTKKEDIRRRLPIPALTSRRILRIDSLTDCYFSSTTKGLRTFRAKFFMYSFQASIVVMSA